MDIAAAELAIITQINVETSATALAFPEDPELYVNTHPQLVHLVRFDSAEFAESTATRQEIKQKIIMQETRVEWVVVSVFRHLTSHNGMYVHLEALRKALTGFTIPGLDMGTALFPVRRSILKESKGLWYYQSIFAMTYPEAEDV